MTKPDKEVHEPLGTNFKRSHIDIYIYILWPILFLTQLTAQGEQMEELTHIGKNDQM